MMMRKAFLAILLNAALCTAAAAQEGAMRVELDLRGDRPAELSTPQKPYVALITESVVDSLSIFTNARGCNRVPAHSILFSDVSQSDPLTQQLTRDGGRMYSERVFVNICGAQYVANYYVLVRPGEAPSVVSGVAGQTRASPMLQRDVFPSVIRVARTLAECPEPNAVGVAHTTAQDTPLGSAWEIWLISACNKVIEIPIRFAPAPQGGINYGINGEAARVR